MYCTINIGMPVPDGYRITWVFYRFMEFGGELRLCIYGPVLLFDLFHTKYTALAKKQPPFSAHTHQWHLTPYTLVILKRSYKRCSILCGFRIESVLYIIRSIGSPHLIEMPIKSRKMKQPMEPVIRRSCLLPLFRGCWHCWGWWFGVIVVAAGNFLLLMYVWCGLLILVGSDENLV